MIRTTYCVWELTLQCNLACAHCGSRAGTRRHDELSTEEALDVVCQLAEVGVREVTLIGGEAWLRRDWLEIAAAIVAHGMTVELGTGGYGISAEAARRMAEAGLALVSVSVDGLAESHDRQRARPGSFDACFDSLEHLASASLPTAVNTQINRLSLPDQPRLHERLLDAGVQAWQWGLTVPMGRAVEQADWLLQPAELVEAYEVLAVVARQAEFDGLRIQAGNNIGYYGPYERLLRGHSLGDRSIWQGCHAGLSSSDWRRTAR